MDDDERISLKMELIRGFGKTTPPRGRLNASRRRRETCLRKAATTLGQGGSLADRLALVLIHELFRFRQIRRIPDAAINPRVFHAIHLLKEKAVPEQKLNFSPLLLVRLLGDAKSNVCPEGALAALCAWTKVDSLLKRPFEAQTAPQTNKGSETTHLS